MRQILAATALLAVVGGLNIAATPAEARDYPWCSRTADTDFNPGCSFTSYPQCMATVNGIGGDCVRNPALAYGEQPAPVRRGRHQRRAAPINDGWDQGW